MDKKFDYLKYTKALSKKYSSNAKYYDSLIKDMMGIFKGKNNNFFKNILENLIENNMDKNKAKNIVNIINKRSDVLVQKYAEDLSKSIIIKMSQSKNIDDALSDKNLKLLVKSLNNNLMSCLESMLKDTSKNIENDQEKKLLNNLINTIKTKSMNIDALSTKYVKNAILNVLKQEKYGYGIIDLKNYEDIKNFQRRDQAEKTFNAFSDIKYYIKNIKDEFNEKKQYYENEIKKLKDELEAKEYEVDYKDRKIKYNEGKIERLKNKIENYKEKLSKLDDENFELTREFYRLQVKFIDSYYNIINVITYIIIYFVMSFILYLLLRLIMGKNYKIKYSEILLLKPNFFKTVINFFRDKNRSGGKKIILFIVLAIYSFLTIKLIISTIKNIKDFYKTKKLVDDM